MGRLSKFNPVARAIAVIGATAGLVTGVTFAALTSNTVALAPNSFALASASLEIGANCDVTGTADVPGFTNVQLSPGVESAAVPFCLANTGDVAMDITAEVPDFGVLGGGQIDPHQITLTLVCTGDQPVSGPLDQFTGTDVVASNLGADEEVSCSATAKLASDFDDDDGGTVPEFRIEFTGTQVTE